MRSNKLDEASGLSALMRGIGSSIGIAVVSWLFVRQGQVHWRDLLSHINPFNPALLPYQSTLGLDLQGAGSIAEVAREITRHAEMQAFNDLFWFIGWVTLATLPLLLLVKRPEAKGIIVV
jgi:DHA2 family multidrug resistance protein